MSELVDFGSLLIQSINFAIVAFVLHKFFFVPYTKYLDEEAIKRKKLELELSQSELLLASARSESEDIKDKAKLEAKIMAKEIVENAQRESTGIIAHAQKDADAVRAKGFSEIALERKELYVEMKTRVMDIALKLNAKLFTDADAHKKFIEKSTQDIEI